MEDRVVLTGQMVDNFEMATYNPVSGVFEKFSLEEAKASGKWTVLVFYPADFTFVCPTELSDLAEQYENIKKLGAEVVSVSTDTEFSHFAWRNSEKLLSNVSYPMAADPTGKVSKHFGVYDVESGLALRGTFIINPQGQLVSSEIAYYNVGRSATELLRKVSACVYVSEHPNEVCPAKWIPGGKTLTPNEKMVGNVYDAM